MFFFLFRLPFFRHGCYALCINKQANQSCGLLESRRLHSGPYFSTIAVLKEPGRTGKSKQQQRQQTGWLTGWLAGPISLQKAKVALFFSWFWIEAAETQEAASDAKTISWPRSNERQEAFVCVCVWLFCPDGLSRGILDKKRRPHIHNFRTPKQYGWWTLG